MSTELIPKIQILEPYRWLLTQRARIKCCYGGRGAGRSWNFALALLVRAMQSKVRILCAREIQESIKLSTYTLLCDRISACRLDTLFDIKNDSIRCRITGSEFHFRGLFRNQHAIKSLEGIDICDIEEAELVTEETWNYLLPTIRKEIKDSNGNVIDASEIWIRFNTRYVDDPTYVRFVKNHHDDAIVKMINFDQNMFFPEVLKKMMKEDEAFYPWIVKNKWYGEPQGAGRKIWPAFKFDTHVKTLEALGLDWEYVAERGNFYMAMDPAQHYYPACIWIAIIPKRVGGFYKYAYAEFPNFETLGESFATARHKTHYSGTLLDLSRQFFVRDGTAEHGVKVMRRFIDTRFAKGSGAGNFFSNSTYGIVGEFSKQENGGLIFEMPQEKLIDSQKQHIIRDLEINLLQAPSDVNEPNFFVHPSCTNLIESLMNHRLEDDSEKESEKYKDMSDTLKIMYAGLETTKYIDPRPKTVRVDYAGARSGGSGWMGN